jgi:hypothetical protein
VSYKPEGGREFQWAALMLMETATTTPLESGEILGEVVAE